MTFSEFLNIRGQRTSYILMIMACIASFYLAFTFRADSISILFAGFGTFSLLSTINIVHEHRLYRSVSDPTFIVYARLMDDLENIKVLDTTAVYGNPGMELIYKRQYPGYLKNEEFESFSLVEQEIIEYPFKQAVLMHQRREGNRADAQPGYKSDRHAIERYTNKDQGQ